MEPLPGSLVGEPMRKCPPRGHIVCLLDAPNNQRCICSLKLVNNCRPPLTLYPVGLEVPIVPLLVLSTSNLSVSGPASAWTTNNISREKVIATRASAICQAQSRDVSTRLSQFDTWRSPLRHTNSLENKRIGTLLDLTIVFSHLGVTIVNSKHSGPLWPWIVGLALGGVVTTRS